MPCQGYILICYTDGKILLIASAFQHKCQDNTFKYVMMAPSQVAIFRSSAAVIHLLLCSWFNILIQPYKLATFFQSRLSCIVVMVPCHYDWNEFRAVTDVCYTRSLIVRVCNFEKELFDCTSWQMC